MSALPGRFPQHRWLQRHRPLQVMTPIRPRTSPGVHQDHRPSVYDDPPPRAPDLGDFLTSEPPAHSPAHLTNNLLRRLPRPHPVIDYEGPSSSELRPPTRGQRLKFRSSTATTSSRSSGADTEDMRLLLSNSFDASRLYVAIEHRAAPHRASTCPQREGSSYDA